ncbi:energy transducer TonB [Bermanella marisrubri]|uniref:TonB like protein n=1 Tax=Bermanella marisrubri TaxID=207949 RepID=Q1MY72_9GAMM|nr:energy transducer TonB [Bermanella marisrubri]EAT10938.1 TonB like protein [Oceanobacter sp. RED65] [Bermanella marisrubri]QIZ83719.1 energy transducer TonB [Bermanella marisrubri]
MSPVPTIPIQSPRTLPRGFQYAALTTALLVHAIVATWLYAPLEKNEMGNSEHYGVGGINIGSGSVANDQMITQRLRAKETKTKTPKPDTKTPPVKLDDSVQSSSTNKIVIPKKNQEDRKPLNEEVTKHSNAKQPLISTGLASDTENGGQVGALDHYMKELLNWLHQHKRYPKKAKRKKIEGVVHLAFTMNRKGEVLEHRVEQSSGSSILDNAALRVLVQASPLPPVPQDFNTGKTNLSLVLPVEYKIQ